VAVLGDRVGARVTWASWGRWSLAARVRSLSMTQARGVQVTEHQHRLGRARVLGEPPRLLQPLAAGEGREMGGQHRERLAARSLELPPRQGVVERALGQIRLPAKAGQPRRAVVDTMWQPWLDEGASSGTIPSRRPSVHIRKPSSASQCLASCTASRSSCCSSSTEPILVNSSAPPPFMTL
jgi:hypothetical protein